MTVGRKSDDLRLGRTAATTDPRPLLFNSVHAADVACLLHVIGIPEPPESAAKNFEQTFKATVCLRVGPAHVGIHVSEAQLDRPALS